MGKYLVQERQCHCKNDQGHYDQIDLQQHTSALGGRDLGFQLAMLQIKQHPDGSHFMVFIVKSPVLMHLEWQVGARDARKQGNS
jgi:hypothetical protein